MKIDTLKIATNARVLWPTKPFKKGYPRVEKIEPLYDVFLDPDMPRPKSNFKQSNERISVSV